jgi:predicted RNase H-like nuclease (RuvC/YqgF family)
VSEPKRYALSLPEISYGTEESPNGEYVRYEDYARLKAEVEKLKALTAEMDSTINVSQAACRKYRAEVERLTAFTTRTIIPNEELQAQVERLTADNEQLQNRCDFLEGKQP